MIQYKYFHTTGSGFTSRMSIERNEANYRYYNDIFEKTRKGVEVNSGGNQEQSTFTYATVAEKALFMQATKGVATSLFVSGLLCDPATVAPARYIDKFEKNITYESEELSKLPEAKLPAIGNISDSFRLAEKLHHIFPKLVDALIYGDQGKQIIIIADNRESAVNYIKVLSLILPLSYMKNIGFSIGTNAIPYEPWTAIRDNGELDKISVKIWLPDIANFNFNSYSSFYYIFDTVSGKDNYNDALSATGKALEEINLCDSRVSSEFASHIACAFSDTGHVDLELLKKCSTLYLFSLRRDLETAKIVLNMGSQNDPYQTQAVITAIQIMLSPENANTLSPTERSKIIYEYKNNDNVAIEVEDTLFRYLSESYRSLIGEELSIFEYMISSDSTGERLDYVFNQNAYADFNAFASAFSLSCRVLGINLSHRHDIYGSINIIRKIIAQYDINRCRSMLPVGQANAVEIFFEDAFGISDERLKICAISMLMSSAYFNDVDEELCAIRIRGFKRMVEKVNIPALNKLELILNVRKQILEFADEISQISTRDDFMFNNELGRVWIQELLSSFSVADMLTAYNLTLSRTHGRSVYEGMINALELSLLNVDYVRAKVIQGSEIYRNYIEFFASLPQEKKEVNVEIYQYINEQNLAGDISRSFARDRCSFLLDCYNTLSCNDRKKITNLDDALNLNSVSAFSEKISKIFLTSYRISKAKSNKIWDNFFTIANGVIWFIFSFIIMKLISTFFDFGLQDHIPLVYKLHVLPVISSVASTALYTINISTNSVIKRNVYTAAETLIISAIMFILFRIIFL